jgi:2'-5' RNA ligase
MGRLNVCASVGEMRVFVGITPPPAAIDDLVARWAIAHPPSGRVTPVESWHVTLEFVGEVDPDELAAVRTGLAQLAADSPAVRLRLAGAGTFGRIVWAGVSGELDLLAGIAATVRRVTADALGAEPESRPFRGHLTLARDVRDARECLEVLDGYRGPSWTVDELQLFSSEPGAGPRGSPHYTVIGRWPLGGHDCATAGHRAP